MPINIKDSIESSTIKGSLNGNASTATKATQDSAGQQINTTYIKGLSVSGKTITYTKGDGTTGTITTQDTNTTYSTGTASTSGLTKLYTGTGTATDGTMTQSAINSALSGKVNKTGDTMTGSLTVNNNLTVNGSGKTISITVPNTSYAWISTDTSSGLYLHQNLSVKGEIYAGANYNNRVYHTGFKPTPAEIGAAASSHSHQSLATANDNGSFSQNYSGFKRPNNHPIGSLAIHCAHPENNSGGYSRGISFNYGDSLALWTYAFSPDGAKHTKTRIYTEDYRPHTYGTGAPNNSDGRPDGSIYYRYA